MSSRGKKKTTMAKLSRESRLRERRQDKEARKEARRHAAAVQAAQPEAPAEGQENSATTV
ncbi:MAG TPA: hypothetical protein VF781_14915 [Solirubrobacteraceae bacterium]